jgi:hypothetical protein
MWGGYARGGKVMMKEEFEKRVHEFAVQIYTEGYEEGREETEMDTKTRVKDAYEKGLEDAWSVIIKIENMTGDEFKNVFGFEYDACFYEELSVSKAIQKIKEYEERHDCENCAKAISAECVVDGCEFEPKQTNELKVGDEIIANDHKQVITAIINENLIFTVNQNGQYGSFEIGEIQNVTGRHFPQIAKVLKQLRGGEE